MAVLLGVLGIGVYAAAPAGSSPYDALSPVGDTVPLDVGQTHWYAFQYGGDESLIRVDLWGVGATFSVWTQSQIDAWARGDEVEPVGRDSDDEFAAGDRSWAGSFNTPGVYYVRVEHAGAAISHYALEVSGGNVTYPMAATKTDVEPVAPAPATSAVATAVQKADGSGPADALNIDGQWRELDAGATHWYVFTSHGADSQITIQMTVSPHDGATFDVWTGEQIRLWALGQDVEPVGRGTSDDLVTSGPSWSGSFIVAGDYYVAVENYSASISHYSLGID